MVVILCGVLPGKEADVFGYKNNEEQIYNNIRRKKMRKILMLVVIVFLTGCTDSTITSGSPPDGDLEQESEILIDGDVESDNVTDGDSEIIEGDAEADNLACEPNSRWCEDTFLHVCNEDGTDEYIPEDCGPIGCEGAVCVEEYALEFDSETSHVDLGEYKISNEMAFTVEMWVKPLELTDKLQWLLRIDPGYALKIGVAGTVSWVRGSINGGYPYVVSQENVVTPGQWVHIAVVNASDKAWLFIDGRLRGHAENLSAVSVDDNWNANFQLGRIEVNTEHPSYKGVIDELRISDTARYLEDFEPAFRHEVDENTIGLYHFDEGSGDVATDSSGNGLDGSFSDAGVNWDNKAVWRNWECVPHWDQCLPDSTEHKVCKEDGLSWNDETNCGPIGCEDRACVKEFALNVEGEVELKVADSFLIATESSSTVEAWVMIDSQQWQRIYSEIFTTDSHYAMLQLVINQYGAIAFGQGGWTDTPDLWVATQAEHTVKVGQWAHIAATRETVGESKIYKIFLNGELGVSGVIDEQLAHTHTSEASYIVGIWSSFDGRIDEFRVSDTVRYTENFTPALRHEPDENTLGLWRFNEGSGSKYHDSSSNNYHAIVPETGTAWSEDAIWRNWDCVSGWMSCEDATRVNSCNASGRWVEEELCSGGQTCETLSPAEAVCQ